MTLNKGLSVLGFLLIVSGACISWPALAGSQESQQQATQESTAAVEPRAVAAVSQMVEYFKNASTLEVTALISTEDVSSTNQKLQFDSTLTATLMRPNKVQLEKRGHENIALWYDGKVLTVLDRKANKFAKVEYTGDLSGIVEKLEAHGIEAPFAGMLHEGILDHITKHASKGDLYPAALIGETQCNHIAIRQEEVDWQLWTVQGTGAPRKIVITTKMQTSAPQHQLLVTNLQVNKAIDMSVFTAQIPAGAEQVQIAGPDDTDSNSDGGQR